MNTSARNRSSVGQQPLALRMRPDLIGQASTDARIAIKDPIALRYHSLREDEWFVLQQLRQSISLETLRQRYQQRYAPRKVTLAQLQALLFRFHRSELVVSLALGQAETQTKRHQRRRQQRLFQLAQSLLFVRFPGVDPSRLLRATAPIAAWLLHPLMLAVYLATVIAAGLLLVAHFAAFRAELPSLGQFLRPTQLLMLGLVIGMTKIAHELGHAMVCHHRGGECHEIGPMLLVLTPALYCDTSDAWMMPRRRDRIAVTAAGMATEIVLAALATFVWYWSHPGGVHQAAINVMLVCSVSTVMFNANPLLRYDGYYLLSDLCNAPNLAQRARQHFHRLLGAWLLGLRYPASQRPPREQANWLAVYSLLALAYRLFITAAILLFLTQVLKPYGLQSLGWLLAAFSLGVMLVAPFRGMVTELRKPTTLSQLRPRRLLGTAVVIAGLALAAFVPVTHHVSGPVAVRSSDETPIFVHMSGHSVTEEAERWRVLDGQTVAAGDPLLRLQNRDLQRQLAQAETRLASQELLLQQLRRSRGHDPDASNQLPYVESALVDLQQRVAKLRARQDALQITAPHAGRFIAAPAIAPQVSADALPSWSGTPTDSRQSGAWLTTGVRVGSIVIPDRLAVDVQVSASDIEFIRIGQPAVVHLNAFLGQRIAGHVHSIGQRDDFAAAATHDQEPEPSTRPQATAAARPEQYVVRVELQPTDLPLRYFQTGQARILVETRPLAVRLYRWLTSTFRFG